MTTETPPKVGYMNPPQHTRFKKGKSGNPRGRPRKQEDLDTVLHRVLNRKVRVKDDDQTMPIRDALMRKLRELRCRATGRPWHCSGASSMNPVPPIPMPAYRKKRNGGSFAESGGWRKKRLGRTLPMSNDDKIGYANPPRSTRWQKGQSGNPKGRPATNSEIMMDAARILTQPVDARGPDGRTIRLEAIEAAYLALCRKGLKGRKPSLLEAIRIMMDVGPAVQEKEEKQKKKRQDILDRLERMGVPIPKDSELRK